MKIKKCVLSQTTVLNSNVLVGDPQKKAILVVSFGTSYRTSLNSAIGAIERRIIENYSDYEVRRAFTSQKVINKLEKRDGIVIDNVIDAMERLVRDGIGTLVVQPTHIMSGFEYEDMIKDIKPYEKFFCSVSYGVPLLSTKDDYDRLVDIITSETSKYSCETTAIVFMGHGTEHTENAVYVKLDRCLKERAYFNYFIGTVEAEPSLLDVVEAVRGMGAVKVVLQPLMIVAGDHASNDMASDEKDSWKTVFKEAGFKVECIIKGLGEFTKIQDMFVKHCRDAVRGLI